MKTIVNFFVMLFACIVGVMEKRRCKTPPAYFTRMDPCAGASVYSAEYTNNFITTPPVKSSAAQLGGRIRIFRATYTQGASAGAIGDIVYFGRLPSGATRVPGGKVFFSTGAASSTLKIGMVGADADMCAATSITTAGSIALDVFAASGAISKLTADTDVIGTVAGAGIAATQVLTVWQPYVMND